MKKIINLILVLLVIISFGKVAYKEYKYFKDKESYKVIKTFKPIIENNITEVEEDKIEKEDINQVSKKENELLNINDQYKMWIKINNTAIDYPIVQGEDNEFYLEHNFTNENSLSGCLFIDYRNKIDTDKNIIIYGHHMKNGTMFNNLNYFKNEDFFSNNEIIIRRSGKEYKYKVFSVYTISESDINFIMNFKDQGEYLNYIKILKNKSFFYNNIDINTATDIITLITCSYEYDGARTVIHAINSTTND